MSVDMDVHGYPWIWISMDIHRKSVDMDMDMDVKFHIHGNPANLSGRRLDVYHTSTHGVALVRIFCSCRPTALLAFVVLGLFAQYYAKRLAAKSIS